MKVLAIVNPVSGRRNLAGALREVVGRVREAGGWVTVRLTGASGDAARLAGDAPNDTGAILVVGGDGTVREVVAGLIAAERTIPLAIMPTGTENLVAKELGLSTEAIGIARTLMAGRPLRCDVGVVNGRHFLLVAGVGFDAEVVQRLVAGRRGHISHWDYFWPICRTFAVHQFPRLTVTSDGEQVFAGRGLAFVGVMGRYSLGLRILRRARPDDGLLDLCVMPCDSRARLLSHVLGTLRGNHDLAVGVVYKKCLSVRVEGEQRVPLEIDGDFGGALPADYAVLPGAVTFLQPHGGAPVPPGRSGA